MKHYRVVLINTKTGERRLTTQTFKSAKKADEWATMWMKAVPNSDCEVVKV